MSSSQENDSIFGPDTPSTEGAELPELEEVDIQVDDTPNSSQSNSQSSKGSLYFDLDSQGDFRPHSPEDSPPSPYESDEDDHASSTRPKLTISPSIMADIEREKKRETNKLKKTPKKKRKTGIKAPKPIKVQNPAKIDVKVAIEKYFKFKAKYLSKNEKSTTKTKKTNLICLGCGRFVGMSFSEKQKHYIATCGDTSNPCQFHIDIFRGEFADYSTYLYGELEEEFKKSKEKIILQKLHTLFGYVSPEMAVGEFEKELSKYNENSFLYKNISSEYEKALAKDDIEIGKIQYEIDETIKQIKYLSAKANAIGNVDIVDSPEEDGNKQSNKSTTSPATSGGGTPPAISIRNMEEPVLAPPCAHGKNLTAKMPPVTIRTQTFPKKTTKKKTPSPGSPEEDEEITEQVEEEVVESVFQPAIMKVNVSEKQKILDDIADTYKNKLLPLMGRLREKKYDIVEMENNILYQYPFDPKKHEMIVGEKPRVIVFQAN